MGRKVKISLIILIIIQCRDDREARVFPRVRFQTSLQLDFSKLLEMENKLSFLIGKFSNKFPV